MILKDTSLNLYHVQGFWTISWTENLIFLLKKGILNLFILYCYTLESKYSYSEVLHEPSHSLFIYKQKINQRDKAALY